MSLESNIEPLLIVGNKRSGSTQMMRLLNIHPSIHITNESDVLWILHQFHADQEFTGHRLDAPAGMNDTLSRYQEVLDKSASYRENYINLQKAVMKGGGVKNSPVDKSALSYLGDQKPYQNIDPEILPEHLKHFPNTKFLHLIRHPFAVVDSSMKFENGTGGHNWANKSASTILEEWGEIENWVEQAEQKYDIDIFHVKYEDVVANTQETMNEVFKWLGVQIDPKLLREAERATLKNFKAQPRIQGSSTNVQRIMSTYNYPESSMRLESPLYNLVRRKYHAFVRRLKFH